MLSHVLIAAICMAFSFVHTVVFIPVEFNSRPGSFWAAFGLMIAACAIARKLKCKPDAYYEPEKASDT